MINEEKDNESTNEEESYPIYMIESSEELDELCGEDENDLDPNNQIYN